MENKIIAVDFDGTIVTNEFPKIGKPRVAIIEKLKTEIKNGSMLILWTCREGQLLEEAKEFCKMVGLRFESVNDNIPCMIKYFGSNPRKIFANEYWDDRAIEC